MTTKKEYLKEFKEITKIKKKIPKDVYIKYLERIIKILLKNNHKLNKITNKILK